MRLSLIMLQRFLIAIFTVSAISAKAQIIPSPVSVITIENSAFKLPKEATVSIDQSLIQNQAFIEILRDIFPCKIMSFSNNNAHIVFIQKPLNQIAPKITNLAIQKEAYNITISNENITIEYADYPGLIHALTTCKQLNPKRNLFGKWIYKTTVINDYPRFQYRGMHLDVCRHFYPASFIKKYLKMMSFYKYNTFHWHLTEDQGWRIEIKKYPKLTQIGGFRKGSQFGKYSDQTFDTATYGGYYTQEEIKEIVGYAKALAITVIPEIEMPGHALAALSAYPEYSCNQKPLKPAIGWGVFDDVYCAGNDQTFEFLQNILDEVIALFPESPYIHIGGDECPKTRWKTCNSCQSRMKTLGLKDEHELQSYFIQRIEKYLNSKGKNIIGWDEILEGGLAPNATVMSWRGTSGGIEAANQNHNVIMTPGKPCYFDHYQGDKTTEPIAIGGYNPLDTVYFYNPVPSNLPIEKHKFILGAQANLWTEYMPNEQQVEYMALPRASALAEVLWSPQFNFATQITKTNDTLEDVDLQIKNADSRLLLHLQYLDRLKFHEKYWKEWKWNYRQLNK